MRVFSVRKKVEFPELLLARTQTWIRAGLRYQIAGWVAEGESAPAKSRVLE
jgi:hypothetical protein